MKNSTLDSDSRWLRFFVRYAILGNRQLAFTMVDRVPLAFKHLANFSFKRDGQ